MTPSSFGQSAPLMTVGIPVGNSKMSVNYLWSPASKNSLAFFDESLGVADKVSKTDPEHDSVKITEKVHCDTSFWMGDPANETYLTQNNNCVKYISVSKKELIPKQLRGRPFSVKEAEKLGLTRLQISRLRLEGLLTSLETGVYAVSGYRPTSEDVFRIAALRLGEPSAICLLSALAYYGFRSTPDKIWVLVPASKRTTASNYVLLRARKPNWSIGIEGHDGFDVTTPERTIVDCLLHQLDEGLAALRRAPGKSIDPQKVLKMADKLKVGHRIRPYLEVLL